MRNSALKIQDDSREVLKLRHSFHVNENFGKASQDSSNFSKSELNMVLQSSSNGSRSFVKNRNGRPKTLEGRGEYYKRYEHDEVPVKDSNASYIENFRKQDESLTNSELDKLETRIFSNVSEELQTDDCSLSSLESNIKFFKTTVEKIFDNFYSSMRDFEHYKQRFHEILARSKDGTLDDMEDFIQDMFEHIMSSDSNMTNTNQPDPESMKDKSTYMTTSSVDTSTTSDSVGVTEAYKNDNYFTDSTHDEKTSKVKSYMRIEEIFKIVLLDGNPCVQIKLNERNLLSEINFKEPREKSKTGSVASADNIKKVAAKRMELEEYVRQPHEYDVPDRNIPVKVSNAKKNIHLDEDFARENIETAKSFFSKICNLLCKKFRKTALG